LEVPVLSQTALLDRLVAEQRIGLEAREAVRLHVETNQCRVEDALVETGALDEGFLLKWLAATHRTRFVSSERLERADVERSVLAMVPQRLAEERLIFPVFFDASDKSLAIVTVEPDDDTLLRDLAMRAGVSQVKGFVARPLAIRAAIRKHYGGDQHAFRKLFAEGTATKPRPAHAQRSVLADRVPARPSMAEAPHAGPSARSTQPGRGLGGSLLDSALIDVDDGSRAREARPADTLGDTGLYALPSTAIQLDPPTPRIDTLLAPPPDSRPAPPQVRPPPAPEPQAHVELEVVNVLVSLLENQRNELRGHSAQVARLMQKVATHMGLSAQDKAALRLCGLLHDVGKSTSYHLTALNVAEYEAHRAQAKKSYLAPVRLFDRGTLPRLTVEGLTYLYERFDGEGFPERRSAKDIPLAARLLAIGETYADLTGNARNPFRKTLGVKAAVAVLGRYRDALFDGALLDVFRAAALGEEIASGILQDRPTILIADADADDTTVLELRLAEQGSAVVPCRSPEQALERLAQGGVDLLICEVEYADKDGLPFLDQVRALRGGPELPIIVLTRRSDRAAVDRAFALGIADYMIKPAASELVIAKVRNALARVPSPAGARGVSGSIGEMPLPDVIQVLSRTRKSGLLHVSAEGREGELAFGAGAIYTARFGALMGEEAVYALLALRHGTFSLDSSYVPETRMLHKSTDELLLEGMRRLDEQGLSTGDFSITRTDDVR
jgi:response regulator RpfG family c-di-GMP phosphodiesterase